MNTKIPKLLNECSLKRVVKLCKVNFGNESCPLTFPTFLLFVCCTPVYAYTLCTPPVYVHVCIYTLTYIRLYWSKWWFVLLYNKVIPLEPVRSSYYVCNTSNHYYVLAVDDDDGDNVVESTKHFPESHSSSLITPITWNEKLNYHNLKLWIGFATILSMHICTYIHTFNYICHWYNQKTLILDVIIISVLYQVHFISTETITIILLPGHANFWFYI